MQDDRDTTTDPSLDDADFGVATPVSGVMSEQVTFVAPTTSLRDVAEVLRTADVSLVVVGDETGVHGVVSERDIVHAVALGIDVDETDVGTIDTETLKWATSDSTIDDVAEEMLTNYLRHILVRDRDGGLAGVVSMRDVLAAYVV